ncbi:MAG TPA: hypothetical protein VNT25_03230, partial [Allosphingosinicella sp.]|nr:hypothetical protein [Allosphingosinicella sp.]
MPALILLALHLVACGGSGGDNAAQMADQAEVNEAPSNRLVEGAAPAPPPAAAAGPAVLRIGSLEVPYDRSRLTPVNADVPLPPDWKSSTPAVKLLAADRAGLIGKAECMYGQAGEASTCNAAQEAGLAFAEIPLTFAEAQKMLPADQRKSVTLASAQGLSWEIGAEGEGAEYIM